MAEPSVSIITPSFNQGRFVERTIRSVLEQAHSGPAAADVDYLVIDGGSDDGTVEILRRYDRRLRFVSEPDDGQADAINKGLTATSGEIVGWLNSDDVYYPGTLRAVTEFLQAHPEVDIVYGDADHIDENDGVIEPYYCEPWNAERLVDVCFLCQPAVFFRRRVISRLGPLDTTLRYCMDYELWLRAARAGMRFAYLRRPLAGSRLHASNKTLGERLAVHAEINDMLRRTLGSVPDRWLSNYAHAAVERLGIRRDASPLRFVVVVSVLSWGAALRWNRRIPGALWRTTRAWLRAAVAPRGSAAADVGPGALTRRYRNPEGAQGLRIGFDVSQTGTGKAGCGQMADALIRALVARDRENDYLLYASFGGDVWDAAGPEATCHIEQANVSRLLLHATHDEARDFWRSPPEDLEARLGEPDIVHSVNFFCPPLLRRARLVYTLHDLAFLVHPEWTTEENRLVCFEGVFEASLRADLVLCVSAATRSHFHDTFPHYPRERTGVVHLASRFDDDDGPVPRPAVAAGLDADRFLLSVATLEPRKNPARLLRAYAVYLRRGGALPLVLAGGSGWLLDGLDELVSELAIASRVRRLGYVEDDALRWLYRNCAAFVYPSLFEGFGLPVVEALSQGAAVLTSELTSLPEVAGAAALYVDPTSEEAIAQALVELTTDVELRRRLRRAARSQARRFSWQRAAAETLEWYRRVVAMPKLAGE